MIKESKQARIWRAQGLCVGCGGVRDLQGRFVKCERCREKYRKYKIDHGKVAKTRQELDAERRMREFKNARQRMEAQAEIEARKQKRMKPECKLCEYPSFTGEGFLCPFPEGACIKMVQY